MGNMNRPRIKYFDVRVKIVSTGEPITPYVSIVENVVFIYTRGKSKTITTSGRINAKDDEMEKEFLNSPIKRIYIMKNNIFKPTPGVLFVDCEISQPHVVILRDNKLILLAK